MNAKRLFHVALAVAVTVAVIVAAIIGCGPKWGDGSVLHESENGQSPSAAGVAAAAAVSVTLPSYYMENMVFQRNQPLVVKGTVISKQDGKPVKASKLSATLSQGRKSASATAQIGKKGSFTCTLKAQKASLKPYSLRLR